MNHSGYRHLSMPCPVMRGGLWLIMEGSEEFEMGRLRQGRCGGDLGCAARAAKATCSGRALWRSSSGQAGRRRVQPGLHLRRAMRRLPDGAERDEETRGGVNFGEHTAMAEQTPFFQYRPQQIHSTLPAFPYRWPFCAESRLRRRGRLDERRRGITVHRTRSTLNSAQRLALCAKPQ